MVHPTSVTNAIDRLEAQGLVRRVPDSNDRRRTLAALTPKGKRMTKQATRTLSTMGFGLEGLEGPELDGLYSLLRRVRESTGDFPADGLAPGHLPADDGESGVIDASHPAC
jgi:DNA-binding MarR family transcriptional regulator